MHESENTNPAGSVNEFIIYLLKGILTKRL